MGFYMLQPILILEQVDISHLPVKPNKNQREWHALVNEALDWHLRFNILQFALLFLKFRTITWYALINRRLTDWV